MAGTTTSVRFEKCWSSKMTRSTTSVLRYLRSRPTCGCLVLLACLVLLYYGSTLVCHRFVVSNQQGVRRLSARRDTDRILPDSRHLVLFWTPLFGSYQLWLEYFNDTFQQPCASSCEITTDKSRIKEASAVIFSAYSRDQIDPPTYRDPRQIWVFFSQESPSLYTRTKESYSKWQFNWTLTYRMDSDVRLPYGRTLRKKKSDDLEFNSTLVIQDKTKLAAAVISHCSTPFHRLAYIEKLRKAGLEVDLYGKCGTFKCPTGGRNPKNCFKKISKTYKFVLAFENSICKDYATEKLFEALQHPWIPVVIGGADYKAIAPPKSVIDATSMSIDDLANLLMKLDGDDGSYAEYFQWRSSYEVKRHSPWGCWFCEKLTKWMANSSLNQTYPDIHDWWVTEGQCRDGFIVPR